MQRKGFTLVELLVVVGIIGVLASVSIVSLNSVRQKGRDAKRISEVKQMQSAMEAYFTNGGSYPVVAAATILGSAGNAALCPAGFAAAGCANPFMAKVNTDPLTGTVAVVEVNVNNGKFNYVYQSWDDKTQAACTVSPCSSYRVTFYLEAGTGTYKNGSLIAASASGITQPWDGK